MLHKFTNYLLNVSLHDDYCASASSVAPFTVKPVKSLLVSSEYRFPDVTEPEAAFGIVSVTAERSGSLLQHRDVGHAVDLRQLPAVQRGHELPGAGQGRDDLLGQGHGCMTADVSEGRTGNGGVNGGRERRETDQQREQRFPLLASPVADLSSRDEAQSFHVEYHRFQHLWERVGE